MALADHLIGRRIAALPKASTQARVLLAAGVIANLAILAHFKYTRFLLENLYYAVHGAAASPPSLPEIILPIGVSFIVFEKITYLVDIRAGSARLRDGSHTIYLRVLFSEAAGRSDHQVSRDRGAVPRPARRSTGTTFSTGFAAS